MKNLTVPHVPIVDTLERNIQFRDLSPIRIDSTQPKNTPQNAHMERTSFILAPGLIEDGDVLKAFAGRLVRAGLEQEKLLTVYRYNPPMTGPESYNPETKAGIFTAVTEYGSMNEEAALGVIAHSQGCGDVTMLSVPGLLNAGYVDHLTSVAPAGHGAGKEETTLGILQTLGRVIGEAAPHMISAPRTIGALALNGLYHIGTGLNPAIQEAKEILKSSYVAQIAELSQKEDPKISMLVMACIRDTITPPHSMYGGLVEAGYRGEYTELHTNHIGPLVEPWCASAILEATFEVRARRARVPADFVALPLAA